MVRSPTLLASKQHASSSSEARTCLAKRAGELLGLDCKRVLSCRSLRSQFSKLKVRGTVLTKFEHQKCPEAIPCGPYEELGLSLLHWQPSCQACSRLFSERPTCFKASECFRVSLVGSRHTLSKSQNVPLLFCIVSSAEPSTKPRPTRVVYSSLHVQPFRSQRCQTASVRRTVIRGKNSSSPFQHSEPSKS